jgi:phosphatidylethanolamine-binding protein (PEBP) family uncharacterized protein
LDSPEITVTSASFGDHQPMPRKHAGAGVGDNQSPELTWSAPPEHTRSILLIIEDIDVPLPRPLLHTVAVLPPDMTTLHGGALHEGTAIRTIPTLLGRGYAGPRPIPGHGRHRYRFIVLALDTEVPQNVTSVRKMLQHIRGAVQATGVLTGTYETSQK